MEVKKKNDTLLAIKSKYLSDQEEHDWLHTHCEKTHLLTSNRLS